MTNISRQPEKETVKERSLVEAFAAQSILGHGFTYNADTLGSKITSIETRPLKESEEPYRNIDDVPVYHITCNKPWFQDTGFNIRKIHRWGEFYDPTIIPASYEIGGYVKLYVDTRVAGLYLLRTATRVDFDEFPGVSYDLVAWTPRRGGDSIRTAGFRLVHAALLSVFIVKQGEWKCNDYVSANTDDYEKRVFDGVAYAGTSEVAILLGACSKTSHKSNLSLKKRLAAMPEYLRPLYESGAAVNGKDRAFEY
jgi:hypothetical protein